MATPMQPPPPSTPSRASAVTLGGGIANQLQAPYRPKAHRTKGARLACLVNASVTVCPDNTIYAFGGFDQFTDEVYNHVLRLDLQTFTWTLVDNFGDIPSVRMGHTTIYWKDNKLIVFGGENEHRTYLSDIYIFDIATATWEQPTIEGPPPRGRSRHAVVLYDEKLFVTGGTCGSEVLADVTYLDLRTMTWSRTWNFVSRFDHTAWVKDGRLYVFGGLTQEMDRTCELDWLDLRESPVWKTFQPFQGQMQPKHASGGAGQRSFSSPQTFQNSSHAQAFSGHPVQAPAAAVPQSQYKSTKTYTVNPPDAPGSINSLRFIKGPSVPSEAIGNHFHRVCGSMLLDFVTPANTIRDHETSLVALDLDSLCWRTLADGEDVFVSASYRWHYLAVSPDQATAYLLGCPSESGENEYLSDILPIDLRRYGVEVDPDEGKLGGSGTLGMDLAGMFDDVATSDFVVTAMSDSAVYGDEEDWAMTHSASDSPAAGTPNTSATLANTSNQVPASAISPSMHVHKLILLSRWQHFSRLYNARMAEFHSGKLYIPEPYSVVKAFLYYLYSDSIAQSEHCASLTTVAGLLVLANIYNIPRLRALSLSRINKELDVESAAAVWERAVVSCEDGLRIRAARFCMLYWGRVVRTEGFRRLSRKSMMELCEEIDIEGRVLGVDELELVGGLAGGRISHSRTTGRYRQTSGGIRSAVEQGPYWEDEDQEDDDDDDGDEGMEIA